MPISARILLKSPVKQVFKDKAGQGVASLPFCGQLIDLSAPNVGSKITLRDISPAKAWQLFRETVASLPLKRCISPTNCHLRLVYQ
jgi:hypothetical protein